MNDSEIFRTVKLFALALCIGVFLVSCGDNSDKAPVPGNFKISGEIGGVSMQDVTMFLTGPETRSVSTDASGKYSFAKLSNGSYTVTPVKEGYIFNPGSTSVNINGVDITGPNFTATSSVAPTFALSGTVSGVIVKDVMISLSGSGNATTITNAIGKFGFFGLANGSYTATPALTGYTFNPPSLQVTINNANATFDTFTSAEASAGASAVTYSISGAVSGEAKQGVTMNMTGAATMAATTDASGRYNLTTLGNGSYTMTPVKPGFIFEPTNKTINISNANIKGQNFKSVKEAEKTNAPVAETVPIEAPQSTALSNVTAATSTTINSGASTISGMVRGAILQGVTLVLTNSADPKFTNIATSDATGSYRFTDIANGSYKVIPIKTGFRFRPISVVLNMNGSGVIAPDLTASNKNPGKLMGGTIQGVPLSLSKVVVTVPLSLASKEIDGGVTSNLLTNPQGITDDGTNLYLTDSYNHKISELVVATGVLTTLAGSGSQGGMDGTGKAASFNRPDGITNDSRNLYVADTSNHKIRKIEISTGIVTTLAGSGNQGAEDGTGTAATFYNPSGITTDGSNLYVSDQANHNIRKIVIDTGVVTTLAGSDGTGDADGTGAAASFNYPAGITTNGSNLYVADAYNHKIRKIVIASGTVTTVAGSGIQGGTDGTGKAASFNYPGGITTDGSNLYVVDYGNHSVRKIVIATGIVTTVAGSGAIGEADGTGTAASFYYPNGITSDGNNLFVADSTNQKIRRIE